MSEINIVYEMDMINEVNNMEELFYEGRLLDILMVMLTREVTPRDISHHLGIPVFSVQVYLKRLLDAGLIKVEDSKVVNGRIERRYGLKASNIDFHNQLSKKGVEDTLASARHFGKLVEDLIAKLSSCNEGQAKKAKAYFIKTTDAHMKAFKEELDALFEKYQSLETTDGTETYGFVSVLAPSDVVADGEKED